jgi:manganese transport protein
LSFALPFPVIALIVFTSRKSIMGNLVNARLTTIATSLCATIILALNLLLLYSTFAPLFGWKMFQ